MKNVENMVGDLTPTPPHPQIIYATSRNYLFILSNLDRLLRKMRRVGGVATTSVVIILNPIKFSII